MLGAFLTQRLAGREKENAPDSALINPSQEVDAVRIRNKNTGFTGEKVNRVTCCCDQYESFIGVERIFQHPTYPAAIVILSERERKGGVGTRNVLLKQ